jgi:NAD(P)-dependent dehydrogenase (short-subunit alcohol dehydrogenase family)
MFESKGTSRMKDVSGKTAIITGAASGIGLGITEALAEAGANVVMADIQKDAVERHKPAIVAA